MKILYGFSNCTDALYYKIYENSDRAISRPDQKYHGLLIRGLSKFAEKIYCVSGLPVNRSSINRLWVHEKDETESNVHYHYITTINFPMLRRIMVFCGTLFSVLKTKRTRDTFAICDCLNVANAYGMAIGAHLKRIPVIMIVTDLPDMIKISKVNKNVNNLLFKMADGFVLLTEQMNERLNKKEKPFIVMEGHVDAEAIIPNEAEKYEIINGKKVIIYAGSIKKLYGIQNLVEGFQLANIKDAELWIYGDGDYRDELKNIISKDERIKYMGVRNNAEVVQAEIRAALLVNPRPSAPEYTKYSFPSKNMEYMVSGTPVLTTNLPGMPEEYKRYVYIIEKETSDGIAHAIKKIFDERIEDRNKRALLAREFVLEKKNNVVQAEKIISLLQRYI